jgi:molecular chaperone DnaJ
VTAATEPDHYRVLGVAVQATQADIRANYRKLSRVFHPDLHGGSAVAEDCFKRIAAAYAELSDADRRSHYDRLLMLQDPLRMVDDPRAGKAIDVLDRMVTRLRRRPPLPAPRRGRDLKVRQTVDYARAALGGEVMVRAEFQTPCAPCGGQGTTQPERNPACHVCLGAGVWRQGLRRLDHTCSFCRGRGFVLLAACSSCQGEGHRLVSQEVPVRLPPRTRDGATLRVRGAGEQPPGGVVGDLVVTVAVAPHPLLREDGDDLVCDLPLTWLEATAGARLQVPTLEGLEWLTVPPATPAGREFRISQRGLPLRDGQRGALRVRALVDAPAGLGPADLETVRQLERSFGPEAFQQVQAYRAALAELQP